MPETAASTSPPTVATQPAVIAPADAKVSIWRLVLIEINRDDILLRSSALAYSSLASLVPIFAIVLAVLSGPAFKDRQEKILDTLAATFVPHEDIATSWIIDNDIVPHEQLAQQEKFKNIFRENIVPLAEKAGAVSVFGFLVLVLTVGLLLRTVERSFNAIWHAGSQRSFFMRLAIGTSMIFWGPVMLALSVTLTEKAEALPVIGTIILPMVFTTLAFTMFYMLMPNAKVKFSCALTAGAVAAVCWEIVKLLFLVYVTKVVSYNRVYGSLGLIPMLFLWVYVNWVMVLAGAELAYCLQFRAALSEQWLAAEHKRKNRMLGPLDVPPALVVAAAIEIAKRFQSTTAGGVRVSQLAQSLKIEPSLARQAANRLVAGGILAKVVPAEGTPQSEDTAYLPASDPRTLDVSALLQAIFEEAEPGSAGSLGKARALLSSVAREKKRVTLADLATEA